MTLSLIASRNCITSKLEGLAIADVSRSGGDTWAKFIYPAPAPRKEGLPEFCQPAKGRWIWGSNEIIISFPKDFSREVLIETVNQANSGDWSLWNQWAKGKQFN
jgi:hypothetical protein